MYIRTEFIQQQKKKEKKRNNGNAIWKCNFVNNEEI